MTHPLSPLFARTVVLGAALVGATAGAAPMSASSAASSASESVATSVGSVSNSIAGSSNSSTGTNTVADGDYRVQTLAAAPDRPGHVRMALQAAAGDEAFFLTVPQATVERSGLAAGQLVSARQRSYGIEFARVDTRQAFFLVLADAWFQELASNPVSL